MRNSVYMLLVLYSLKVILKYSYKDEEHAEKKYFIQPFFFLHISYKVFYELLYLHSAKDTLAIVAPKHTFDESDS